MFSNTSLMPHAVCWAAAPRLVWTMVIANAITFLSYVVICATLLVLARRTRRVIARDWAYFLIGFALFIVACGSTHLLEVITTWNPVFWVDAGTNILTAGLSAWVAIAFLHRAGAIGFGVNDYAARLSNTEREKKRVEDSLLSAQRLEEWSRLSTVMAHEISSPLEAIQNTLYLLRTHKGITPDIVELTRLAEQEAARVIEISRSTLGFFRQTATPELVDLAAAADSVRFLVAPLLQQRGLSLHVSRAGDVSVRAYSGEVRQVLLNLIRNACEASHRPDTSITVELTGKPEGVEMVITDQGSGIAAHLLPSLFQFGASTKGENGNGMGLWSVKHILERHGGTVQAQSATSEGTRFLLFWPRHIPQPQAETKRAPLLSVTARA